MPVIANPADPSYCNFGRDGVELCTPEWYREGPEATWLAEATLAAQLGNEGTRQGKEARARHRSSQSADPCGNLRFPLGRPPWDLDPSRGMGLRAVVHADMCCPPARRGCRAACCSLWPSAPDSGGGRWGGYQGCGQPSISPSRTPARVSVDFFFFDEAVCGVRWAGHVLRAAYCAARGCECETKPCLGMHSFCLAPRPGYDNKRGPRHDQQNLPWAHFILVVINRATATLSSSARARTRPGGRRQRKLSLSSRDDPNYKGIMRLRAQVADRI